MLTKDKCCCKKMWEAVKGKGPIPINLDMGNWPSGIEFLAEDYWRKDFATEEEFLEIVPYSLINNYCPFCGKNISDNRRRRRDPKYSKGLCGGMLSWFIQEELSRETGMVEYDHRNNKFYLHNRKGFGYGYTLINFCTSCGEPLSAMIEKYGIPDEIKARLHSDEWWKKRGL